MATSPEAVARVALVASDVLLSVQPSLSRPSPFTPFLHQLPSARSPTEIRVVRESNDPLLDVYAVLDQQKSVSVLAPSSILIPSIPHLFKLSDRPVVLHVLVGPSEDPDYSIINAVRDTGFALLQSGTVEEAQDIALAAELLARRTGSGVIHFFSAFKSHPDQSSPPIALDVLSKALRNSTADPASSVGRSPQQQSLGSSSVRQSSTTPSDSVELPDLLAGSSLGKEDGRSSTASQSRSSSSKRDRSSSVSSVEDGEIDPDDHEQSIDAVWKVVKSVTGRQYQSFQLQGDSNPEVVIVCLGTTFSLLDSARKESSDDAAPKVALLQTRLYTPWDSNLLLAALPTSVRLIAVLERVQHHATRWGPLFMAVLTAVREEGSHLANVPVVSYLLGHLDSSTASQAIRGIIQNLQSQTPIQNLFLGTEIKNTDEALASLPEDIPGTESAYLKILHQLFGQRLHLANQSRSTNGRQTTLESSPEYAFGTLMARSERRAAFVRQARDAMTSNRFTTSVPEQWMTRWLKASEQSDVSSDLSEGVLERLRTDGSSLASDLISNQHFFHQESDWIISSDAWSYDLGSSGVHHVISSGENINMLIIDSTPYSRRAQEDAARRKKDIGLYAMNYGKVYVASVAVYSSYTQVLQAMTEAANFKGPSVVLAYLPYETEQDSPLFILQETKKAVDSGYWPLYRWHPGTPSHNEGNPSFELDSNRIKCELEDFLKRDNHMTLLIKQKAELAPALTEDFKAEQHRVQKKQAAESYSQMLDGLYGAPLTILYASDNGNAEGLARRLGYRGKARGLKTMVHVMDDYAVDTLPGEENVVMFTSVAGQGEFPQNGRLFWEAIKTVMDLDLSAVNASVFGLGDSHYWPRKGDEIYFNKSAKDLDRRLNALGAQSLVEIGLGDDQDPDGYNTAYNDWEAKLWTALGVDKLEGLPEEPPPLTNEDIKIESNFLRGTISEGLKDKSTGAISASDQQLTKFHGTYMQDDRDLRDERKAQGAEPAYSFMIRCRLPGGVATPSQWLQMDQLSAARGNQTMKLTTRQTFQFHGVIKGKLRSAMQDINQALMTTVAACGDVNRNVMVSGLPEKSQFHGETWDCAKKIDQYLLPSTTAYHEIWLKDEKDEKVLVAADAVQDFEPMYGPTYLPRKFKISVAIPPHNDVDVYAHDVGLIAIKGEDGHLAGFNVLAGGGMGVTHNNTKTYPRTGSTLGYYPADKIHLACEKIMLVQRNHGDRKNRKHARLKYTIDDMGVDVFRSKVEALLGEKFAEARPYRFDSNVDTFGWQKDEKGMNHFTFFIENGRIEDTADFAMKTGLREIAKVHSGEFRLTGNQHLILSNVSNEQLPMIKDLMRKYKLDNTSFSSMRLSSSACVAFPTCGLAMAESERFLPGLLTKLEATLEENGLTQDSIVMRVTGCPNGCARPWLAEIGLVGKAYGVYNMYLGGGYYGERLSKLYRSNVDEVAILAILRPLLKRYSQEREKGERFGDFCIRVGLVKETKEGKYFHDDVHEDDEEVQAGK